MYISSVFRVTNKPLKGWVYLLYCKIIECVLNIQCHYNKINQSINQSINQYVSTRTLVSVRTFGVMYDHTFLNLQITRSGNRLHIKWVVSLVIAYGHFNLPEGFLWGCMG